MIVTSCKTNRLTNPMGFDCNPLRFSWIVEESAGKAQEWARTRYYWRVTVMSDAGDFAVSVPAWFETGICETVLPAQWITPKLEPTGHPYMRRAFMLPAPVASARLYATGLGLYHMKINDRPVSEERHVPFCNAYDHWIQLQTYDVTAHLQAGENCIGAMLGRGWARSRMSSRLDAGDNYCDRFGLLAALYVTLADGTAYVLGTDETWQVAPSPVLHSDIYDGETYDARLANAAWSTTGAFESAVGVDVWAHGLGPVRDRLSPPLLV